MNQPLAIYVSGPYNLDPVQCTARAIDVGQVLLHAGHAPFVPHLSHYWETLHHPNDYEFWMQIDLEWVRRSDVIVRVPGQSSGADREVELARELGIPVFVWEDALRPENACPDDMRVLLAFHAFTEANVKRATTTDSIPPAIDGALNMMRAIFASKNADYAEGTWDSNFADVARQMGFDRETAADVLIAVKQARLRSLRTNGRLPQNEAVADTVLDRAVYALIALAMHYENGSFS
jgi:hypothetical protein